jgi:hypothetical protein
MKFFNTTGPCNPQRHYMLPAAIRLPGARRYITRGQYFVVRAPRQTGKTTSLGELARQLSSEGRYVAVHFSCETGGPFDDIERAEVAVLDAIRATATARGLPQEQMPPQEWPDAPPGRRLHAALTAWVATCPKPLVLFFDEIDALRGESLVSVLRQLRDGYTINQDGFVHSVVLCGVQDVSRSRAAADDGPAHQNLSSLFNISVASIRICDFDKADIAALYAQHTDATGQEFSTDAIDLAFHYTRGRPRLVNALAAEAIAGAENVDPITECLIEEAKERLFRTRGPEQQRWAITERRSSTVTRGP